VSPWNKESFIAHLVPAPPDLTSLQVFVRIIYYAIGIRNPP
jgi:hypothetical protein